MQAWWRVLRGVYPYKWSVFFSMICALGVGLSYASGITVMYPVMKIFTSAEQLQGWADRTSAQSRLGAEIADLDSNIDVGDEGLVVKKLNDNAPPNLKNLQGRLSIPPC